MEIWQLSNNFMFNFVQCPQFNEYFYGNVVFVEAVKKNRDIKFTKPGKEKVKLSKGKQWKCLLCQPGAQTFFLNFMKSDKVFFVAM